MKPSKDSNKKTNIIGLTGGIGSGKSTVSFFFRQAGIPVIDADAISRAALDPGTDCYQKTVALFGPECLHADGSANRQWIAAQVFSNTASREALNAIIHPYVLQVMQETTAQMDAPIVIWEVPLLFESGYDHFCDRTVAVLCDEKQRIQRILQRDGVSEEQACARIRAQITDEQRKSLATEVIYNEGDREELQKQVLSLLERWRNEL